MPLLGHLPAQPPHQHPWSSPDAPVDVASPVAESVRVVLHGDAYTLSATVDASSDVPVLSIDLELELEAAGSPEQPLLPHPPPSWHADFPAPYLEGITTKTGSLKRFPTFVTMLLTAMRRAAGGAGPDTSVSIELLTLADLDALRGQRDGGAASAHTGERPVGAPAPAAAAALSSPLSGSTLQRRYLILTYTAEFDRVHYPLPLSALELASPAAPAVLLRTVARLRGALAAERAAARLLRGAWDGGDGDLLAGGGGVDADVPAAQRLRVLRWHADAAADRARAANAARDAALARVAEVQAAATRREAELATALSAARNDATRWRIAAARAPARGAPPRSEDSDSGGGGRRPTAALRAESDRLRTGLRSVLAADASRTGDVYGGSWGAAGVARVDGAGRAPPSSSSSIRSSGVGRAGAGRSASAGGGSGGVGGRAWSPSGGLRGSGVAVGGGGGLLSARTSAAAAAVYGGAASMGGSADVRGRPRARAVRSGSARSGSGSSVGGGGGSAGPRRVPSPARTAHHAPLPLPPAGSRQPRPGGQRPASESARSRGGGGSASVASGGPPWGGGRGGSLGRPPSVGRPASVTSASVTSASAASAGGSARRRAGSASSTASIIPAGGPRSASARGPRDASAVAARMPAAMAHAREPRWGIAGPSPAASVAPPPPPPPAASARRAPAATSMGDAVAPPHASSATNAGGGSGTWGGSGGGSGCVSGGAGFSASTVTAPRAFAGSRPEAARLPTAVTAGSPPRHHAGAPPPPAASWWPADHPAAPPRSSIVGVTGGSARRLPTAVRPASAASSVGGDAGRAAVLAPLSARQLRGAAAGAAAAVSEAPHRSPPGALAAAAVAAADTWIAAWGEGRGVQGGAATGIGAVADAAERAADPAAPTAATGHSSAAPLVAASPAPAPQNISPAPLPPQAAPAAAAAAAAAVAATAPPALAGDVDARLAKLQEFLRAAKAGARPAPAPVVAGI